MRLVGNALETLFDHKEALVLTSLPRIKLVDEFLCAVRLRVTCSDRPAFVACVLAVFFLFFRVAVRFLRSCVNFVEERYSECAKQTSFKL